MDCPPKLTIQFGGRALGEFTRGELVELHSKISCVLDFEKDLAVAWLSLKPEQRERVNRILGAILWHFSDAFALGCGTGARQRRIACGLLLEFEPDLPVAAVAVAVRASVACVESNARWLKRLEGENCEGVRRDMARLRASIRKALDAPPGTPLAKGRQRR